MNIKKSVSVIVILAASILLIWSSPFDGDYQSHPSDEVELFDAVIRELMDEQVVEGLEGNDIIQTLGVEIVEGTMKGEILIIKNDNSIVANSRDFKEGDKIVIAHNLSGAGGREFYILDYARGDSITWLFVLFIIVVVAITRKQGLGSIFGMFVSFVVLLKIVLPEILVGAPPVSTAIIGAALIIPVTFYASHGLNKKTTIAVAGTLTTLIITGFLATYFADLTHLTGLASEETAFLKLGTKELIDFKGMVLAGMIISLLGILDDITISQSAVIFELKKIKSKMSFRELYDRSMSVGRDHIASMVNTLVLVYTGASLPLLLLFLDNSQNFSELLNYEFIVEEVVRTLIGSIGLILAVPITSLFAAYFVSHSNKS